MHNNITKLVNTFISTVIEGIVQDVTERIDTVDNDSVQSIATDVIVDYDYTEIVTDHATDVVDNYDFSTIVEEAVDDYDFSDTIDERVDYRVDHVLSVTDFSTYVEDALRGLDVKADCDAFADRLSVLEERQRLIITALTNATDALRGLTDCVDSNQI
tara:strand:+ start:108 stop:581 length:474 start_codon:yes stop_codon:yes gene_type:complete